MQTDRGLACRLSSRLRTDTRDAHEAVERSTGWPDTIVSVGDYRRCLKALMSIWRPFEETLAQRRNWDLFDVGARRQSRLSSLDRDLRALGENPADISSLVVTSPTDLAGMIGAVYVLEGSALGGRVILADVLPRLGAEVAGATAFFSGQTDRPGPRWREIVQAIDDFGAARPTDEDAVVSGARQAFGAFLLAFRSGSRHAGDAAAMTQTAAGIRRR